MRKRKIFSFIAFVIMFTLCVGQLHPLKTKAAPIDEKVLTISSPVESKFDSPGQIHWYKVVPGEKEIADFTHFRIKLQTEQELNISVYSSLENAMNNITFDRYMRYSYANSPALIDFPIAWTGSYYVKVEYNGEEGTIEETENPANEASAEDVPYTISYDGVSLPPSDQTISEECPAELSTKERENGKSILKDLRAIRDTVLSKTEDGKNLSSLYYKVAPYISAKLIFSKDTRDQVYKGLVQLKNLAADVAKNGNASTYTITKEDQEAINNLYSISRDSVPDSLKEQIDHMASKVGLSNLTNRTVSSVLTEAGLAEPEANTNLENRYIVKLKDGKKRSSFQSKAKSFGVNSIDPIKENTSILRNMIVMELDAGQSGDYKATAKQMKATAEQIAKLPEVEFVERVQKYQAFSSDAQNQNKC
jgi:cell wall-associated protease